MDFGAEWKGVEGVCSHPSHSPSTYRPGLMCVSICVFVCTCGACVCCLCGVSLYEFTRKTHVGVVVYDDSVILLHAVQVCLCACIVFIMFHSVFHTELEETEQVR